MGYQAIKMGDASVMVCGGQESMSSAPHAVHMRSGTKMGPATLVDTMVIDGLTDAFHNCHMGITGEPITAHFCMSFAHILMDTQHRKFCFFGIGEVLYVLTCSGTFVMLILPSVFL